VDSLSAYLRFYDERRPHRSLGGQTPDAIYFSALTNELRATA